MEEIKNEDVQIKILHIVSNISTRNGIMSVIMNYYRNINVNKYKFCFLYFDSREVTYEDEIRALGGEIYKFERKSFIRDWKDFCNKHYERFDILHNHELYLSLFFQNSYKKIGNKILISHAHTTKFADTRKKELRNKILSYAAKKFSDYLLACSNEAGLAMFGDSFGERGYILKNAINPSMYCFNKKQRIEMKKKLHIGDEDIVIGHVGAFVPQKNHIFLLEVYGEILKKLDNVKLLLIGTGGLRECVEKIIRQMEIEDRVIIIGGTNNVPSYLNVMDIFLFPSNFEGLGIALIEAQANGLPCVFSDVVPFDANIISNRNVVLNLNESSAKWADEVINVGFKRTQIENEIANAGYDITKEAHKLAQFYSDILNNKRIVSLKRGNRDEV